MNNERKEKVWGSVIHIFTSDHTAISCLWVNVGFRCSRHYHVQRINQFTVLSGCIEIEEWPNRDQMQVKVHRLYEGDTHVVPAMVVHRFTVVESGQVVEVYWPERDDLRVELEDIVRLDEGGPIPT